MCNCTDCRFPIIIGGFNPTTIGWYMLLALYLLLAVYAFVVVVFAKKEEPQDENNENESPVYSVFVCTAKDADGNPYWSATFEDVEGVLGIGQSPAEAVDNLLSQVDKQKGFEKSCSNKKEGE